MEVFTESKAYDRNSCFLRGQGFELKSTDYSGRRRIDTYNGSIQVDGRHADVIFTLCSDGPVRMLVDGIEPEFIKSTKSNDAIEHYVAAWRSLRSST